LISESDGEVTTPGSPPLEPPRSNRWVMAGLWVFFFGWCLRPIWGIDIFFHVAIGRHALEAGIPNVDILSAAHPDAPWAPFQIGYEFLVAWIERLGGLDALRVLHAGLFATGITWAARFFRRKTGTPWLAAFMTLIFLFLFEERIRLRPHAFNLIFEVFVLLPLAAGDWRKSKARWGIALVGVAALWAFLHAVAVLWLIAVLGTVLVFGVGFPERSWGALTLGLSALGIALAPGALDGISHVLQIQDSWGPFVPELAPSWSWFGLGTTFGVVSGVLPWLAVTAVLGALAWRPKRERWPTIAAAAGFAFAAVWMVRLSYYAPFAIALVAPEVGHVLGARKMTQPMRAITVGLALLLLAHVAPRFEGVNPWTQTLYPDSFPDVEVDLMTEAGFTGGIFNETEWGGYLLYRLHPSCAVLSDGRVTFQPDVAELLRLDDRAESRSDGLELAWKRYGVDLAVRRKGKVSEPPGWELLLRGPVADVWSRRGEVNEVRRAALGKILASRQRAPSGGP
jgi:hypothetical protein